MNITSGGNGFAILESDVLLKDLEYSVLANLPVFALDIRDKNSKWSVKYSFSKKDLNFILGKTALF